MILQAICLKRGNLARRLGPERCWRAMWPEGCKDANDVLMAHGPQVLQQCIAAAKPYPIEGILEVADVAADVMLLYEQGLPRGVSTGSPSIDPYYTVKPGELTLVTGIPSHGKSEWLDWLMVQLAKLQGWVFAICSPENLPLPRHISKLAEKYVGLPFRAGSNGADDVDHLGACSSVGARLFRLHSAGGHHHY